MSSNPVCHNVVGAKAEDGASDADASDRAMEKDAANHAAASATSNDETKPDEEAQAGVAKIEAVTLAWSRSSLYLVLVLYAITHCVAFHHAAPLLQVFQAKKC